MSDIRPGRPEQTTQCNICNASNLTLSGPLSVTLVRAGLRLLHVLDVVVVHVVRGGGLLSSLHCTALLGWVSLDMTEVIQ